MPGIDFVLLRRQISLTHVLDQVGFTPTTRCGPQWRGPCPVHGSKSPRSRSFVAQVEKNCWHCFRCGAGGNALDLYLAVTKLPVYEGALDMCLVPLAAPATTATTEPRGAIGSIVGSQFIKPAARLWKNRKRGDQSACALLTGRP